MGAWRTRGNNPERHVGTKHRSSAAHDLERGLNRPDVVIQNPLAALLHDDTRLKDAAVSIGCAGKNAARHDYRNDESASRNAAQASAAARVERGFPDRQDLIVVRSCIRVQKREHHSHRLRTQVGSADVRRLPLR
jgi:hypothetical protein